MDHSFDHHYYQKYLAYEAHLLAHHCLHRGGPTMVVTAALGPGMYEAMTGNKSGYGSGNRVEQPN
ncbi:hypothetical protein AMTR_s00005p00253370 [Amborella trichopoda]|uniref:Uncharacterized protein n=1 Tax=Amborella trichopoda TaxID=13333 RepID=W1PAG8_AMBTC|nr:hypothetical protein AMTR_s00005p00253370 [Amborella trichopoda]